AGLALHRDPAAAELPAKRLAFPADDTGPALSEGAGPVSSVWSRRRCALGGLGGNVVSGRSSAPPAALTGVGCALAAVGVGVSPPWMHNPPPWMHNPCCARTTLRRGRTTLRRGRTKGSGQRRGRTKGSGRRAAAPQESRSSTIAMP